MVRPKRAFNPFVLSLSKDADAGRTTDRKMPIITAIEKQRGRRRAQVVLDGELAFSLRFDLIATEGLAAGVELTHARRRQLEAEDQRLGAIEAALRLLAVRPRSEQELRQRLTMRRGFRREAVEIAISRMRELGYLDDAAFARSWVDSRQAAVPRSRRALAFELSRKGVSRDHMQAALASHSDEEAAYESAQRRLRALHGLDRSTFERRLGTFLNSRGFGYGVASATIDRCWQELNQNDP
jgi:regulatory protein